MAIPKPFARPRLVVSIAILGLLLVESAQLARTQDYPRHHDHSGHEGVSMAMDDSAQMDAAQQSKLLADKERK